MTILSRALLASLLAFVSVCSACSVPNPGLRAGTVDHGKLSRVGDVWVLELDGSPVERGKAEGVLLGEQLRWLLPRYLKKVASVDQLSNYQKELVAAIATGIPSAHFDQLNAGQAVRLTTSLVALPVSRYCACCRACRLPRDCFPREPSWIAGCAA